MKVAVFSSKHYETQFLKDHPETTSSAPNLKLDFLTARLDSSTASLAKGADAACIFVNDTADASTLSVLSDVGIRCLLLRCAGFNHVDLDAAVRLGISVFRVPAYSPYAVAEFAVALLLTVVRKTHRAFNRVRESNFAIRGLMGFELHGKTVGIVGTGKIGRIFARIMKGFGCRVIAYDLYPSQEAIDSGVEYMATVRDLYKQADVISLHCPLLESTRHMINAEAIGDMKDGVVLVNTSRGALVDVDALITGLRSGRVGATAMDVIEGEQDLFFEDHSGEILENERVAQLLSFPNVLISPHVAFCTDRAMGNIWKETVANLKAFHESGEDDGGQLPMRNQVLPEKTK